MEQNTLPKNWVEVSLDQLLEVLETGTRPKGGVQGIDVGVPSLGGEHLNYNGGFNLDNLKFIPDSFAAKMTRGKIKVSDILVVKDGATTGKTAFVDPLFPFPIAYVNEHVFICRCWNILESKAIFYFLRSELGQQRILENFTGAAQGGINKKFAPNTFIPLPPLAEQERIVKKLDALFAQLDGIRVAMDRIPQLLKDFRQQVLTQAVTGKLTEEWRKGKDLEDWREERLEELVIKVGSGSTPRGGQESYSTEGIPLIRSMNVHFDGIHYDGLAYINEEQAYALRNVEVLTDDVLLNITGASIGRVSVAPKKLNGARVNQHVCIIRTNNDIIPYYLALYLSSPLIQSYIAAENYGVTRQALTKNQILNLNVLCPPFSEQEEIVRRIDSLFKQADAIEVQYKSLKEKIDTLPQAILHKAFKGELVEQLPSDGDARDLLRQIEELKKQNKKNR